MVRGVTNDVHGYGGQQGVKEAAKHCPLCGCESLLYKMTAIDQTGYVQGSFALFECSQCSLIVQTPLPTEDEVASYYPDLYYAYADPLRDDKVESFRHRLRRELLVQRYGYDIDGTPSSAFIKFLVFLYPDDNKFPHYVKNGKILDIGCGSGSFLREMKALGWSVCGVELNSQAAMLANNQGLHVFQGVLEEASFDAQSFDYIRMEDVLEHVLNPVFTMQEIHRILKPNGILKVTLPNVDSFTFQIFQEYWFPLELPRHLYFFSPQSIRLLANKTGFEIESLRIWSHDEVDVINSMQYWARDNSRVISRMMDVRSVQKIVRKLFFPIKKIIDRLGKGSAMTVQLRKL